MLMRNRICAFTGVPRHAGSAPSRPIRGAPVHQQLEAQYKHDVLRNLQLLHAASPAPARVQIRNPHRTPQCPHHAPPLTWQWNSPPISWFALAKHGSSPLVRKSALDRACSTLVIDVPTLCASASAGPVRSVWFGSASGSCPAATASDPCQCAGRANQRSRARSHGDGGDGPTGTASEPTNARPRQ